MERSWNGSGSGNAVASDEVAIEQRQGCGGCPAEQSQGIELSFVLENDPAQIPGVIDQIMELAQRLQFFEEGRSQFVALALHEALVNGIYHGNLELDSELRQGDEGAYHRLATRRRRMRSFRGRRVHVSTRFEAEAAIFVIRDEGHGFDPTRLPDPTDPSGLDRPSGRGLLLIRALIDEVRFNAIGNEITLVKRRH